MKLYLVYPFQLLSGIIMLLALLWLTMGATFVYVDQQKQVNKIGSPKDATDDCGQTSYPFNDTEEKTETCSNAFGAEYLQADFEQYLYSDNPLKHKGCYADAFVYFHGESFSPPPESLS